MAKRSDADTLAQLYLDARERLYQTITADTGVGTKTYYNTILRQLEAELKRLKKESNRFIDTRIPREYKRELDSLYSYFTKHNLLMKGPAAFASLHSDAIYTIAREMQYQLDDALITVGRQVTRYAERAYDETLRQAGLRHTGIKASSGGTVQDMRNALLKDLQEQGFMTVQYGEGKSARQVPVDVYAGMVARSTTREAANTARLNQLTENGYDLVELTEHYPTCNICAPLQGRVYSISGGDKRFPPLSRAFGQYNNIHPNCRHVAVPWVESLRTPGEVAAAIEKSNRPFEDSRSAQEVALYNHQQAENRRAREVIYQYERYKAALGDDTPKTYMEFARLKKQGGEAWEDLQDKYRNRLYSKDFDDIIHLRGNLSDYHVRRWYNYHDSTIKAQLDIDAPLEQRARQAHGLRNLYRQQARDLMENRAAAAELDSTRPNISFEALLSDKMSRKGLTEEQAMQDIIETSQTTNKEINKRLGLEG